MVAPRPFQRGDVLPEETSGCFGSVTRSAILYENRAFEDAHVHLELLIQHLHVPRSIRSGVRWNNIETRRAKT